MVVTYTWVFSPLDVKLSADGLTNVVYNVNWRLIGTDGTYSANVYGSVGLPVPSPAAFTTYDQLTEATGVGWIPANQIGSAPACVQGQLDSMANPPVSPENTPLPWAA